MSSKNPQIEKAPKTTFLSRILTPTFTTIVYHPFLQAKVLLQLGYEPVRPKFNSEKKFWLPDGYYYNGILTGYLTDVGIDQPLGKTGLYFPNLTMLKIGLSSRLIGNLVYLFTFELAAKHLISKSNKEHSLQGALVHSIKEVCVFVIAMVVSRPLIVLSIRQIGKIADGDTEAELIKPLMDLIATGEGFKGLKPLLVYQIGATFSKNLGSLFLLKMMQNLLNLPLFAHIFRSSGVSPRLLFQIIYKATTKLVSTVFYPLHLVSTVVANSGNGGILDTYHDCDWLEILGDLGSKDVLTRGYSLLFSIPLWYRRAHSIETAL